MGTPREVFLELLRQLEPGKSNDAKRERAEWLQRFDKAEEEAAEDAAIEAMGEDR